jgi:hypothetical protein
MEPIPSRSRTLGAKQYIDSKTESSTAEEPEGRSRCKKCSQPLNEQIQETGQHLNVANDDQKSYLAHRGISKHKFLKHPVQLVSGNGFLMERIMIRLPVADEFVQSPVDIKITCLQKCEHISIR